LTVTALALLAPPTLEALRLCFLFAGAEGFEQVFFFNFLVGSAPILGHHFLARHSAEFLGGELAADDALAQAGVRLVLEVDEEGADLAPVFGGRAAQVGKDGLFDRDRTVGDEIAGWTRVRAAGVEDRDSRAPESQARPS
jgi:hypothetical protein